MVARVLWADDGVVLLACHWVREHQTRDVGAERDDVRCERQARVPQHMGRKGVDGRHAIGVCCAGGGIEEHR